MPPTRIRSRSRTPAPRSCAASSSLRCGENGGGWLTSGSARPRRKPRGERCLPRERRPRPLPAAGPGRCASPGAHPRRPLYDREAAAMVEDLGILLVFRAWNARPLHPAPAMDRRSPAPPNHPRSSRTPARHGRPRRDHHPGHGANASKRADQALRRRRPRRSARKSSPKPAPSASVAFTETGSCSASRPLPRNRTRQRRHPSPVPGNCANLALSIPRLQPRNRRVRKGTTVTAIERAREPLPPTPVCGGVHCSTRAPCSHSSFRTPKTQTHLRQPIMRLWPAISTRRGIRVPSFAFFVSRLFIFHSSLPPTIPVSLHNVAPHFAPFSPCCRAPRQHPQSRDSNDAAASSFVILISSFPTRRGPPLDSGPHPHLSSPNKQQGSHLAERSGGASRSRTTL